MEISMRELWTVFHGMVFGAIYLLAFAGAIAGIYSLSPEMTTPAGVKDRLFRLKVGLWTMSIISWLTVISGTWLVYIWYRANPPAGGNLNLFPKFYLISKESTKLWHEFGMEWKEHVAWIAPMLTTSVAYSVQSMGVDLANHPRLKKTLVGLLVVSFVASAAAGIFGAFINKIAATR